MTLKKYGDRVTLSFFPMSGVIRSRNTVIILWIFVGLFILGLLFFHVQNGGHLHSPSVQDRFPRDQRLQEGIDSCKHPDSCSKWIPKMYTGYNQTFMLDSDASDNILNSDQISNFCFGINGNVRNIDGEIVDKDPSNNYILNTGTKTFDCIDGWRLPEKVPQSGPVYGPPVYPSYDPTLNFNTIDKTARYCSDMTGSAKVVNDELGNTYNNFKVNTEHEFKCRNPNNPAVEISDIKPHWSQNNDVYANSIRDVSDQCYIYNGGHASMIDPSIPLIRNITFNDDTIAFDCNNFWGGDAALSLRDYENQNKINYKYDINTDFSTVEEVKNYCDPYSLTGGNKYSRSFVCGNNPDANLTFHYLTLNSGEDGATNKSFSDLDDAKKFARNLVQNTEIKLKSRLDNTFTLKDASFCSMYDSNTCFSKSTKISDYCEEKSKTSMNIKFMDSRGEYDTQNNYFIPEDYDFLETSIKTWNEQLKTNQFAFT